MMTRYALAAIAVVILAGCNFFPPESINNTAGGPTLNSFFPTQLAQKTTSLVIDRHSNGQPGQLAIADVLTYNGPKPAITPPAGWTLIRDDSNRTVRQTLYWHALQPGEPAAQTWTFSEPVDAQGTVILLDNAALDSPVDGSSGNTGGGFGLVAKPVTITSDGDFLIVFYAGNFFPGGAGHYIPDYMGVVQDGEWTPHPYWILGTYPHRRGNTQDAVCTAVQPYDWVAAQVAIRRGR
jgi:hypothetical protein